MALSEIQCRILEKMHALYVGGTTRELGTYEAFPKEDRGACILAAYALEEQGLIKIEKVRELNGESIKSLIITQKGIDFIQNK